MGRTPMQVMYCLERVPAVVRARPELANVEPLSGNREAIAKLPMKELEEILFATLSGMTADEFTAEVKKWIETAKHPRWNRPFTELTYQPMLEVLSYLRSNGYKIYIVTGGGQDFVRVYSEPVYGIPPSKSWAQRAQPSTAMPKTASLSLPRSRSSC